jgi:hypothetical protein
MILAAAASECDIRRIQPFVCALYLKLDLLAFCERLIGYSLQVIAVEEEVLIFLCLDEAIPTVCN